MGNNTSEWAFETKQVHIGQESPDPATDARAVPIYQTSSYVFPSSEAAAARFALTEPGNIYTRLGNPTNDVFERRIAALEGGIGALALASGSAATTYAVMNIAKCGDHIVSDQSIYGGSYNLFEHTLPESGITCSFVDASKPEAVAQAIKPSTKLVFVESLGNPNSSIVDIEALAAVAHAQGIPLIVDNTFATPYLLRPLERGADVVIHSATKFIGGHGTSLGGVIVDGGRFDWAASGKFPGLSEPHPGYHGEVFTELLGEQAYIQKARLTLLRDTGSVLAPLHSWLFLQGLETLSLRVERHVQNALAAVDWLNKHPKIAKVNHPSLPTHRDHALYQRYFPAGAGSIFTVEIEGTADHAKRFTEALQLFSLLANVADAKSLVIHPASTTHSQMTEEELADGGISPTTVRLSIGIENIVDILADLDQALAQV